MSKRGAHSISKRRDGASGKMGHKALAPERKRLVERIALCAFCVALVVFVAFSVLSFPSAHLQEIGTQQLEDVVNEVDHANTHIAAMSEMLANGIGDDEDAQRAQDLIAQREVIADELVRAKKQLNAIDGFLDAEDKATAELLSQGIGGRQAMLEYGMPLLEASLRAHELSPQVQKLWQSLLDGHDALGASAAHIEVGTTPEVKKALASDKKAKGKYEDALQAIEELAQAAPGCSFETERGYAEKQLQAAGEAIAADQALLDGKTKTAKQHMASYKQAANEAASIAESLPATADDLLKSIYYSLGTENLSIADAETGYAEAAQHTSEIDSELATYRTSERQTP